MAVKPSPVMGPSNCSRAERPQQPKRSNVTKRASRAAEKLLDSPGHSSNCASPGLPRRSEHQSGGTGFQTRENTSAPNHRASTPQRGISPGENGPELSNQPLRLFLATAVMPCIRARHWRATFRAIPELGQTRHIAPCPINIPCGSLLEFGQSTQRMEAGSEH